MWAGSHRSTGPDQHNFSFPYPTITAFHFVAQTNSERYLWKFGQRGGLQRKQFRLALDKSCLAYLYINAVFLYRVRRGWPLRRLGRDFFVGS